MKKIILLALVLSSSAGLFSQDNLKYGAGYFGETLFHPGIILQAEHSKPRDSSKVSIPLRADLGYYMHKRNHQALFSDLSIGLRRQVGERAYAGIHGGVGVMFSWHHSDEGVFEVDDNGNISQVSSFAGTDFMPSLSLELGYRIKKSDTASGSTANYIYLRPKAFWQMNVNEKALFHYAIELGCSFSISTKK